MAALALALTGCSGPDTDDAAGSSGSASGDADQANLGGTVTIGWNEVMKSLNFQSSHGHSVANAMITYPTRANWAYYDQDVNFVKNTAFGEMVMESEDPLTVRQTINPDAKWSDGAPLHAADMLLEWAARSGVFNDAAEEDILKDPEGGQITGVTEGKVYFDASDPGIALITETPTISEDGKEITFVYSEPFPDWQYNLADYGLPAHVIGKRALGITDPAEAQAAVVKAIQDNDRAALEKIASVWSFDFDMFSMPTGDDVELTVSCGPMIMTDYVENQYITLKKNPDFTWGEPAKIDELIIRYNEDPMAQVQALENGELDIIAPQVTADVLAAVQAIDGVEYLSGYDGAYEHVDLTFNNGGPFDPATYGGDEEKARKVRLAFLKTIPRQKIVDTLIKPTQPAAEVRNSYNLVPGSPTYDATVAANGYLDYSAVDIEGAKALLAEVGVPNPEVRFLYGKSNSRRAQQFQLIYESATEAGFVVIDDGDDEWGLRLKDGTYDASLFAWQTESMAVFEPAANFITTGQNNYSGFSNAQVDALYDELATETDPARQQEINTEVEKILLEQGFGITIFQFPSVVAWNASKVKNVSHTPIAQGVLWNFWDWEVVKS
jgi:peptide/nickel transport system substrate-binding protein